jgi:4-hydroxy-tetrahydrodipicolinate synthase
MLAGIYPIVPTPFNERGEIDTESIRTMSAFMVEQRVNGLAILGVMGEVDRLTDSEREEVVRQFREALPRPYTLVVGAWGGGSDATIQACRRAIDLGADALLVGPPPIQHDAVIFDAYGRINEAVSVPIVVHDYPPATRVILSPNLLARLHKDLRQVQYVKLEDPPTGPKIDRVRGLAGESFGIFGAYGGMYALEELERGACGIMTGFVYQNLLVRLYTLQRAGDLQQAAELFYAILPLIRFEFQAALGISLRKTILVRQGAIRSATVRHPTAAADATTIRQLERIEEFLEARGYLSQPAVPGPTG